MPLKYKLSTKSIYVSLSLVALILLGLHQIIGHSFLPQNQHNDTVDMLSNISNSFNNFGVEIQSDSTGQTALQSKIDIQVSLTIHAPVTDLYLDWALEQDVNINQSELPTESISFDQSQESPITYNAEIQIIGQRPHIIVQAYTLDDKGGKIGESAELYFNFDGTQFLPNMSDETKIRIDPSKIIR